jgi:hypothetical protein
MNPSLKDFFSEEKKRFLTPDPYFHTRVMARIREAQTRDYAFWDIIPSSSPSVLGLALTLMLAFLAVQVFLPMIPPERGFVDSVLEAEQTPVDTFVYSGIEMPADQEFLNQLMGFEEQ